MKETTYMYFYNFRYISSIIIGISSLCVIHVVIGAIWTVDISLGSSVVELLTRVAGVPGSIPGPAIYFHCIYMLIPPFLLHTCILCA